MSDIRLDPATLRWCATWSPRYVLKAARQHFEAYAAEAEARPPLLSDWVRACEGTKCGPYAWDTATEDDGHPNRLHMIRLGWAVRGSGVLVHIVQDGIVHLGIDKGDCDDWDWREVSTPAELRAALDRLAAEVNL